MRREGGLELLWAAATAPATAAASASPGKVDGAGTVAGAGGAAKNGKGSGSVEVGTPALPAFRALGECVTTGLLGLPLLQSLMEAQAAADLALVTAAAAVVMLMLAAMAAAATVTTKATRLGTSHPSCRLGSPEWQRQQWQRLVTCSPMALERKMTLTVGSMAARGVALAAAGEDDAAVAAVGALVRLLAHDDDGLLQRFEPQQGEFVCVGCIRFMVLLKGRCTSSEALMCCL